MSQTDTSPAASASASRVRHAPPPSSPPRASPEIVAAAAATARPTLGLVLFGRDAAGKRRAACFPPEKATEAERAAALMGLQVLRLTDPEQTRRADALPRGRLFASGRALVPFVKDAVLDAVFGAQVDPIAVDDPNEVPPEMLGDQQLDAVPLATTRAGIVVGSLVLVGEVYPLCGWYEAIVVAAPGDDLFALRWRDWPDDPLVARRRDDLALLPPGNMADSDALVAGSTDER